MTAGVEGRCRSIQSRMPDSVRIARLIGMPLLPLLVRCRTLDLLDDDDADRRLLRFEPEAELLLERGED